MPTTPTLLRCSSVSPARPDGPWPLAPPRPPPRPPPPPPLPGAARGGGDRPGAGCTVGRTASEAEQLSAAVQRAEALALRAAELAAAPPPPTPDTAPGGSPGGALLAGPVAARLEQLSLRIEACERSQMQAAEDRCIAEAVATLEGTVDALLAELPSRPRATPAAVWQPPPPPAAVRVPRAAPLPKEWRVSAEAPVWQEGPQGPPALREMELPAPRGRAFVGNPPPGAPPGRRGAGAGEGASPEPGAASPAECPRFVGTPPPAAAAPAALAEWVRSSAGPPPSPPRPPPLPPRFPCPPVLPVQYAVLRAVPTALPYL
eukprot:TRINITY_DN15861_c0_g1_i1.p2 TRINITY_DN15861_c0_g1~~TRINITY_DN15861_c0_g1_i1.p2  ORF type:complete len:338 (+),score=94.81 TRINITY_DN15861_c0_g1_i1:65-1015(+)